MRQATILLVALGVTVLALVVGAALATPLKGAITTPITRATFGTFAHQNDGIKVESKQRWADVAIVKHVVEPGDRKSTRLNSSHANISYAVFCLKKKKLH